MEVARSLKLTKVITRMHKYLSSLARWLGLLLLAAGCGSGHDHYCTFFFFLLLRMTTVDRPTGAQPYKRRLAIFVFFISCLPSWKKSGQRKYCATNCCCCFRVPLCVYKMAVGAPVGRSIGTDFDGIGFGRCCSCFLGVACVEFGS
jgi:hypothetical protein